jgi:hypothetical protein
VSSHLLTDFASARGSLHVADDLDRQGVDQLRQRLEDAIRAKYTRLDRTGPSR